MIDNDLRKPQGLWFGRERSRSFGMLHRPDQPSNRGVIFCNTLGFEGLAHVPRSATSPTT